MFIEKFKTLFTSAGTQTVNVSGKEFMDKMRADFQSKFTTPLSLTAGIIGADDVALVAAIFGGIATILAASTAPILATAVGLLVILIGITLLVAVAEGYTVDYFRLSWTGTGPDARPTLDFRLVKN